MNAVSARCVAIVLLSCVATTGCSMFSRKEPPAKSTRTLPGEEKPAHVVDPDLMRPKVEVRKIERENYEVTPLATLVVMDSALEGTSRFIGQYGVRGAYHLTEDWFVEASFAKASRTAFNDVRRWINKEEAGPINLRSYDLSIGYNLLPGDLYLTKRYVLPFVGYATLGAGQLRYEGVDSPSAVFGLGLKFFPKDWLAIRYELRDRMWFNHGEHTNIEFTFGLGFFF